MKASVAIQCLPKTKDGEEVIPIVDKIIAYIASTGLNYVVCPFETVIEGDDYDQLMDIVKECQHIAIREGAESCSTYVKIWYSPDKGVMTIDEKITKHRH